MPKFYKQQIRMMMDISINSDGYSLVVEPGTADIDFMGHVNNAKYLTWIQAAVLGHWRRTAPSAAVGSYTWVAVKHEITYRKPAFLNETLRINARVYEVRRESAFYEIVVERNGEVLVEANSRWCCLDAVTRRPVRIPTDVTEVFLKR